MGGFRYVLMGHPEMHQGISGESQGHLEGHSGGEGQQSLEPSEEPSGAPLPPQNANKH